MRYTLASRRRLPMKRSLAFGILAMFIGLQATSVLAKPSSPTTWDYLEPDRDQVIASLNIVELLKRHHYNKPPLNDARSAKIFDSYIKMLDPSRSDFTSADLAEFKPWRSEFDDFLKNGNLEPGFIIYKRHLERCHGRLNYALSLLDREASSFDLSIDEELPVDRENAAWAKDEGELEELWRKRVKDEVLR